MFDPLLVLAGGAVVVVSGMTGAMALSCFRKCRPDQAMIVSGLLDSGENPNAPKYKIVTRGGAVIFPIIQQCAYISLAPIEILVAAKTPFITSDDKSVFIKAVARVKVPNDPEVIALAAENFLNKSESEIATIAEDILIGHLRAAVGQHTLSDVNKNVGEIISQTQEVSRADLKRFGLTIPSFSVKDISQQPLQTAQSDAR